MNIRPEDLPVVKAADQDGYDGGYVALHRQWSAYGRTRDEARRRLSLKLKKIALNDQTTGKDL